MTRNRLSAKCNDPRRIVVVMKRSEKWEKRNKSIERAMASSHPVACTSKMT